MELFAFSFEANFHLDGEIITQVFMKTALPDLRTGNGGTLPAGLGVVTSMITKFLVACFHKQMPTRRCHKPYYRV